MADEAVFNGEGRTVEIAEIEDREEDFVDFNDGNEKESSPFLQKIEALEQEKRELARENELMGEKFEKLKAEAEALETEKLELKRYVDTSEVDTKALRFITARAAELETEASRLKGDLISSMTEGQDANKELIELKKAFDEAKKVEFEKNSKLQILENERNSLVQRFQIDEEGVKEGKTQREARVREMEKKIEALEHGEGSVEGERFAMEQETRVKMDEKDSEIHRLKTQLEELESIVVKNDLEVEKLKKETEELEIAKNKQEAHLKESESKVKEMEQKVYKLNKELETSELLIVELKEKELDVNDRVIARNGLTGLKPQWPLIAASTGATVAALAAVCYLRYNANHQK
ncbi:peroxisomal and mitochondrial division factor 2 [Impatiens glandulifera]|uniref:peroxisomal and mitochondrial division factor 2 n=1 Tax=Impatiens glandulifera TaxID=253017 RepID=UPI001FB17A29|nr:peroxisomal and mitochondrial division factor 2 [Impatiens glandulifera]